MSIRTTVTLDEDVLERVKHESRRRGASFRDTLNELLRGALLEAQTQTSARSLEIHPHPMGYRAGVNYDDLEALLELGEGERHR